MAIILGKVLIYLYGFLPIKLRGKIAWQTKPLYLLYQKVYGDHTWQNLNLTWLAPTYKVTGPFEVLMLRDLMTS